MRQFRVVTQNSGSVRVERIVFVILMHEQALIYENYEAEGKQSELKFRENPFEVSKMFEGSEFKSKFIVKVNENLGERVCQ